MVGCQDGAFVNRHLRVTPDRAATPTPFRQHHYIQSSELPQELLQIGTRKQS